MSNIKERGRPTCVWVRTTDTQGRTHMEARWLMPLFAAIDDAA
ncbi:hypothetical protein [Nocardioides piscis]|nr:hypothetical protein [Nocardioides piscis]